MPELTPDGGLRSTLLGARIGFHETQLPRSERELLAVFFDELGATVTEGEKAVRKYPEASQPRGNCLTDSDWPLGASHMADAPPSVTLVQPSLFDNKEAA